MVKPKKIKALQLCRNGEGNVYWQNSGDIIAVGSKNVKHLIRVTFCDLTLKPGEALSSVKYWIPFNMLASGHSKLSIYNCEEKHDFQFLM